MSHHHATRTGKPLSISEQGRQAAEAVGEAVPKKDPTFKELIHEVHAKLRIISGMVDDNFLAAGRYDSLTSTFGPESQTKIGERAKNGRRRMAKRLEEIKSLFDDVMTAMIHDQDSMAFADYEPETLKGKIEERIRLIELQLESETESDLDHEID